MTEKIVNGDYHFNTSTNSLDTVDYIDELLQTIKQILTARRGSFYPNKNFGSLIRTNGLEQPKNEYALAYARQALDLLDGVYVKSASVNGAVAIFNVIINNFERQVYVELEENI